MNYEFNEKLLKHMSNNHTDVKEKLSKYLFVICTRTLDNFTQDKIYFVNKKTNMIIDNIGNECDYNKYCNSTAFANLYLNYE